MAPFFISFLLKISFLKKLSTDFSFSLKNLRNF